jgi:hypothetical protein
MPSIGDLDRVRRSLTRAVGVGAGSVPADHLGAGVPAQPFGQRFRLAVAEQVNRPAGLGVDEHGAVVAAAAEREVVDPECFHHPGVRVGQRRDQPQHAGPARRQVQQRGEPRPGPARQGQRDRGEHPAERRGPPGAPRGQPVDLLGERDRRAVLVAAEEPAHRQPDHHRLPADRRVGQPPLVCAVHPGRWPAAPGARSTVGAGTRPDAQPAAGQLGGLDDHPGQVRQQPA